MEIGKYIDIILSVHSEFSASEIEELCEDYLSKFNRKTKESTKEKSLKRYLEKEFELKFDVQYNEDDGKTKAYSGSLENIPKHYFQSSGNLDKNDYVINVKNLNTQIGKTIIFEDANLKIKANEKIALVGKNGVGKSTLLRILIGQFEDDFNSVNISDSVKIGFLSQDIFWENPDRSLKEEMLTCFASIGEKIEKLQELEKKLNTKTDDILELTGEYNSISQELNQTNAYKKYASQTEILQYFGFSQDQLNLKISQLSGGEQTKVQIAKFLLKDINFLILDEPTNHLDIDGILFLENFCRLWDKNLICISHDKRFLNNVFSEIIEISNKKIYRYHGNYDQYKMQKQKNYDLDLKNYENQQKYLQEQENFIERFRSKASKAAQVQSRIKLLEKLEKIEKPENQVQENNIFFQINERLPNLILEIFNLKVGYDPSKYLVSFDNNLRIDKDMKIGIIGKNGVGKTSFLKTILGEISPLDGNVKINPKLRIGSYSQTIQDLDRNKTIVQEIVGPDVSNQQARALLGALLISNEKMDQEIRTLSGGEKAKVALTKMLLQKPHFIIMDEPTNHLDIDSKEIIKKLLKDFNGVTLIVSHDRDFLEQTSNLLRVLKDRKISIFHDIEKGFDFI